MRQQPSKEAVQAAFRRSQEDIYRLPGIAPLAERCKMGDLDAMVQMAAFFRGRCSAELGALLDQYQADPRAATWQAVRQFLTVNYFEEHTAMGYVLWLVRAALYGDEASEALLRRCPQYGDFPYLSYRMQTGESLASRKIWASSFLWKMGISDVRPGKEDCGILFRRDQGYFCFFYMDFYIPADREGFGEEREYAHQYLDEFLCSLPGKNPEELSRARAKAEARRQRYWQQPHAPGRKYRRRLCPPG